MGRERLTGNVVKRRANISVGVLTGNGGLRITRAFIDKVEEQKKRFPRPPEERAVTQQQQQPQPTTRVETGNGGGVGNGVRSSIHQFPEGVGAAATALVAAETESQPPAAA